jgi:cell division control protein CDC15
MDPNFSKSIFLDRYKEDDNNIEELSRIEELELLQSPKFKRLQSSSPPRSPLSSPSKSKNNENSMFETKPVLHWKDPQLLRTPTKPKNLNIPLNPVHRTPSLSKLPTGSPTKVNLQRPPEMKVSLTPAQRLEKRPGRLLTTSDILDSYEFKENVGKGAFANVYRAINKVTGDEVAVKEIFIEDDDNVLELMSEIDLLKILRHKNIVKYHGFIRSEKKLFIFLEYCSGGSLRNLYKKSGPLADSVVKTYIKEVLQGLIYLHEQGVVHRDVKAANILLTSDGNIKLTDFGVSTKVSTNTIKTYSIAGTPNWMAPEIISMDGTSTASDIWSVGATVVELLAAEPLYAHLNEMAALHAIVTDEYPPIPQFVSEECKDFLMKCFEKQPAKRVTAKDLLEHDWLTKRGNPSGGVVDSIVLHHKKKVSQLNDNHINPIKRFDTKKFLPMDISTFQDTDNELNELIDNNLTEEFDVLGLEKSRYSTNLFDPMMFKRESTTIETLIKSFFDDPYNIDIVTELNAQLAKNIDTIHDHLTVNLLFKAEQTVEAKCSSDAKLVLESIKLLHQILKVSDSLIQDFADLGGIALLAKLIGVKFKMNIRYKVIDLLTMLFERDYSSLIVFIQCGGLKLSLKLLQEDCKEEPKLLKFVISTLDESFEKAVLSKTVLQVIVLSFPNFLDWIAVLLMHFVNIRDHEISDKLVSIICNTQSNMLNLKPIFLNSIFKIHGKLNRANQLKMLRFFKSLNVNDFPDSSNMMKFLVSTIKKYVTARQMDNEILDLATSLIFSICHLNHLNQNELFKQEVLPLFRELLNTTLPCTEFIVPLLCEFSLNNHLTSKIAKDRGVIKIYLQLLIDPVWQANALDSLISLHERVGNDQISKLILEDDYQFLAQSFLVDNVLNYELYIEKLVKFLASYGKSIVVNQIRLKLLNNDAIIQAIFKRTVKYKSDLVIQINLFKLLKILCTNNYSYDNCQKIMKYLESLKKTNVLLVDQLISETLSLQPTSLSGMMKPPPSIHTSTVIH